MLDDNIRAGLTAGDLYRTPSTLLIFISDSFNCNPLRRREVTALEELISRIARQDTASPSPLRSSEPSSFELPLSFQRFENITFPFDAREYGVQVRGWTVGRFRPAPTPCHPLPLPLPSSPTTPTQLRFLLVLLLILLLILTSNAKNSLKNSPLYSASRSTEGYR